MRPDIEQGLVGGNGDNFTIKRYLMKSLGGTRGSVPPFLYRIAPPPGESTRNRRRSPGDMSGGEGGAFRKPQGFETEQFINWARYDRPSLLIDLNGNALADAKVLRGGYGARRVRGPGAKSRERRDGGGTCENLHRLTGHWGRVRRTSRIVSLNCFRLKGFRMTPRNP